MASHPRLGGATRCTSRQRQLFVRDARGRTALDLEKDHMQSNAQTHNEPGIELTDANAVGTHGVPIPTGVVVDAAGIIRWIDVDPTTPLAPKSATSSPPWTASADPAASHPPRSTAAPPAHAAASSDLTRIRPALRTWSSS